MEAGCCGDRGSLCQHLTKAEYLFRGGLCSLGEWKCPIPEEGQGRALWRNTQSKMMGEETCCWMMSGTNWNCTWGQNCWSSHCLCPGLCPCLYLYLGLCLDLCPCPGRGCFFYGCCCHGGCENDDGCGVSGDCGHPTGSPGCLACTPCHPCDLNGGGSDGNGT